MLKAQHWETTENVGLANKDVYCACSIAKQDVQLRKPAKQAKNRCARKANEGSVEIVAILFGEAIYTEMNMYFKPLAQWAGIAQKVVYYLPPIWMLMFEMTDLSTDRQNSSLEYAWVSTIISRCFSLLTDLLWYFLVWYKTFKINFLCLLTWTYFLINT